MTSLQQVVTDRIHQMSTGQSLVLVAVRPGGYVNKVKAVLEHGNTWTLTVYTLETRQAATLTMTLFQLLRFFNTSFQDGQYHCVEVRVTEQPTVRLPGGCTLPQTNTNNFQVRSLNSSASTNQGLTGRTKRLNNIPYGNLRLRDDSNLTDPVSLNAVPRNRAVYIEQNVDGTVKHVYDYQTLRTVLEMARQTSRLGRSPMTRKAFAYHDLRRLRAEK